MAWAEWNGRYRDVMRRFVRGDPNLLGEVASRIAGSADLYADDGRLPCNSVNFITCHDGFTLHDLVSYNGKHNEANGEENRDGNDDNLSFNCGVEGETTDAAVTALRDRQAKNYVALLMLSRGVPMLLAGDEVLRTQRGNNNAYSQDNEISWFDWRLVETCRGMLQVRARAHRAQAAPPVPHGEPVLPRPARARPRSSGRHLARGATRRTRLGRSERPHARGHDRGNRRGRGPARGPQHGRGCDRRRHTTGHGPHLAPCDRYGSRISIRRRGTHAPGALHRPALPRERSQRRSAGGAMRAGRARNAA